VACYVAKDGSNTFKAQARMSVASMSLVAAAGTLLQDLAMHAVGRVVQKLAASYKAHFPPCSKWPRVVKC